MARALAALALGLPRALALLGSARSSGLELRGDAVRITHWVNRLGNNMLQLQSALLYAELLGAPRVVPPSGEAAWPKGGCGCWREHPFGNDDPKTPCCGGIGNLFDLPEEIAVAPNPALSASAACNHKLGYPNPKGAPNLKLSHTFLFLRPWRICKNVSLADQARVLRTYLAPWLNPRARALLAEARRRPADLLTVHLRAGDYGGHEQPPCTFYRAILAQGLPGGRPFGGVLVVTERDRRNPCAEDLAGRLPGMVEVQNATIAEDAMAIAAATNLVLSRSTFSLLLAQLAPGLQRVYTPEYGDFWSRRDLQCLEPARTFIYNFTRPPWETRRLDPSMVRAADTASVSAPYMPCQA